MLLPVGLSVTLALAMTALVLTIGRVGTVRRKLEAERIRGVSLERQVAGLERQLGQLQTDQQFLVRFLREFPHVAHELHNGKVGRKIPELLLNLVMRILEPAQAVVIVRRRDVEGDPERRHRLVVAAVAPEGSRIEVGTEVTLGEGPVGFAAEVQRVMNRQDLDQQPAEVKAALRRTSLPGFEPDLVAPFVSEEQTMGVVAVQGLRRYSLDPRDVLRVIAQTGALAVRSHERLTAIKTTASLDGLTGVFNKRYLTHRLSEEIRRALDEHESLSVFLFDIDSFKHYNDRNGHVAGDGLLRELARLVQDNVRRDSIFGRFGGEEFILVLPGTDGEQALAAAENVRRLITEHEFPHGTEQPLGCLSISGGVATCPEDATESAPLLRAADEALYAAKRGGRNRVEGHVPQYLGGEAQEPVEPAHISTEPEEDDAAATGPLDPALLVDPDPAPPEPASAAELVVVDAAAGARDSSESEPGRPGPEGDESAGPDHLTFGPAWIEPDAG